MNGSSFSADFHDFIACCVIKDPAKRLPAEALLDHFIQKWAAEDLDLMRWVGQCARCKRHAPA